MTETRKKLIDHRGRPYVACPKCQTDIVWPEGLSDSGKADIAARIRKDTFQGVQFAQLNLGFNLREAKTFALHVTKDAGQCHRCHASVSEAISICSKCHSANLDW